MQSEMQSEIQNIDNNTNTTITQSNGNEMVQYLISESTNISSITNNGNISVIPIEGSFIDNSPIEPIVETVSEPIVETVNEPIVKPPTNKLEKFTFDRESLRFKIKFSLESFNDHEKSSIVIKCKHIDEFYEWKYVQNHVELHDNAGMELTKLSSCDKSNDIAPKRLFTILFDYAHNKLNPIVKVEIPEKFNRSDINNPLIITILMNMPYTIKGNKDTICLNAVPIDNDKRFNLKFIQAKNILSKEFREKLQEKSLEVESSSHSYTDKMVNTIEQSINANLEEHRESIEKSMKERVNKVKGELEEKFEQKLQEKSLEVESASHSYTDKMVNTIEQSINVNLEEHQESMEKHVEDVKGKLEQKFEQKLQENSFSFNKSLREQKKSLREDMSTVRNESEILTDMKLRELQKSIESSIQVHINESQKKNEEHVDNVMKLLANQIDAVNNKYISLDDKYNSLNDKIQDINHNIKETGTVVQEIEKDMQKMDTQVTVIVGGVLTTQRK